MKRRTFLKLGAVVSGGAALGFDLQSARAEMRELKLKPGDQVICVVKATNVIVEVPS